MRDVGESTGGAVCKGARGRFAWPFRCISSQCIHFNLPLNAGSSNRHRPDLRLSHPTGHRPQDPQGLWVCVQALNSNPGELSIHDL
jgi:hypothetical protein